MKISRKAMSSAGALALLLMPAPALADCLVAVEPDWCSMMWTVDDDFWVGQYQVEVGAGQITVDGMTMGMPPVATPPATIFQMGADLVIEHPERYLQADLTSVGLDEEAWSWDVQSGDRAGLADMELMLDCSSAELPRWSADTYSDDGMPLTLDLVAVSPQIVLGLLHGTGVVDGSSVSYRRQVHFTRAGYPIEGLEMEARSSAECDTICANEPWRCPDRP